MPLSSVLGAQSLVRPGVCTSTTRPASPFEGQVIYETDTNQVLVYSGTAWVMLGDLDTPGGLQLIKTQTIGTTVSSVTVSDVFSSEFDNYRVDVSGGSASTAGALRLTLGSTTTGYYYAANYVTWANSAASVAGSNAAFHLVGEFVAASLSASTDIFSPYLAEETFFRGQSVAMSTGGYYVVQGGYLNNTTSYTAFTLAASTGTMTGGTIRVYGYRNS